MLFSSSEVAECINNSFEPAWESVRAAPLVTIDFGNGNVVKRTLQGNIVTYVCGSDGTVYDVLPGIYTPDVYRKQLEALKVLAAPFQPDAGSNPPATDAEKRCASTALTDRLSLYHTHQARLLQAAPPPSPEMRAVAQIGGGMKGGGGGMIGQGGFGGGMQGGMMGMGGFGGGMMGMGGFGRGGFQSAGFGGNIGGGGFPFTGGFGGAGIQFGSGFTAWPLRTADSISGAGLQFGSGFIGIGMTGFGGTRALSGIEGPIERVIAGLPPDPARADAPAGSLADRPELKLDSEVNERIRRKAVHDELARRGLVCPNDIKKWLYKDVLHADLDDPMLGLGPVLNANYPFVEEDKAAEKK